MCSIGSAVEADLTNPAVNDARALPCRKVWRVARATGSGDSGGPILVAVGNEWHVAGITAWRRGEVNGTELRPGRYGETSYGARLGNYTDWIEKTIASDAAAGRPAER